MSPDPGKPDQVRLELGPVEPVPATTGQSRLCARCDQVLPLTLFTRNRFRTDGYQPYCIPCGTAYIRTSRGVDPTQAHLRPTVVDRCGICNSQGGTRGLFLDHDHHTGAFRGWLCYACNTAIGMLGDDPDRCRRAADYIEAALDLHQ